MVRYYWRRNLYGFSRGVEWEFRNLAFAHLQKLPLRYFQHVKTGDLMSRLTSDMTSFRELIGFGVVAAVDSTLLVSLSLALMLVIDPWLTLWAVVPLCGITPLVLRYGNPIYYGYKDLQKHLGVLTMFVQENLAGIRVVQAYAQEENQQGRLRDLSLTYLAKNMRLVRMWGFLWPALAFFSGLAGVMVLWLGGRRVMAGLLSPGDFAAFIVYLAQLTWPLMAMGYVINMYQRGSAALGRVVEILETPPAPGYLVPGDGQPAEVRGEVEFRDLSFRYGPDGPWVLKGISLTIPAGSRLGIVGETGSGKSTLVNLIPRLFEAPDGALFLDGVDIKRIPMETLKKAVGLVSQDVFLFSDTIRENILFGRGDASPEELEEAARIAQILPSIEEFTHRFDTLLGERGVRLSGGQKQRTALARAIIRNSPILILDDAFSSVDTQTEDHILDHLKAFMRGRTTILISHRLSTLRNADRIVYLRDGAIVEVGTHDELLERGGQYARLYRRQLLAQEIEAAGDGDGRG